MKVKVKKIIKASGDLVREVLLYVPPYAGMIIVVRTAAKWCEAAPSRSFTGITHTSGIEVHEYGLLLHDRPEELFDWATQVRFIPESNEEIRLFARSDFFTQKHRYEIWCHILPDLPANLESEVLWDSEAHPPEKEKP